MTTLLSAAVFAAAVAAIVNFVLARRKSLEDERSRVRGVCAEAFEAVTVYKEMPYAIRRRRSTDRAEERIRLSEEMRHVQARLSYFSAWLRGEDATLAAAFDDLVENLREIAGRACHDAWLADPINDDAYMNIPTSVIDLSGITSYQNAYMTAVRIHLDGLLRIRRIFRRQHRA